VSKIKGILAANPEFHYLTPMKRSDSRISKYGMLSFDGVVRNIKENVLCKKVIVDKGHYLYSFQDSWKEFNEKRTYLQRAAKNDNFSQENYTSK